MSKSRRIVYINDIGVIINDVDWNDNPNLFNITFDVLINDKNYTITFSNPSLDSQNQQSTDSFKGSGASYIQFLREVEKRIELRDKNQYSDNTENAANKVFGAIAQSIYDDVQSHSADQDED